MYVNKIEIVYNNMDLKEYDNIDITDEVLNEIYHSVLNNKLHSIELKNTIDYKTLNIFFECDKAFIGLIDEYNESFYYFNNGQKKSNYIDIHGNYYDNRFICYDNKILIEVLGCFALTGGLYSKVKWIIE